MRKHSVIVRNVLFSEVMIISNDQIFQSMLTEERCMCVRVCLYAADIFEEKGHQVVSGHEMAEGVSYNTSYGLVISWKSDPDTSGNIAYGDHQGIPTKDNPAYGQVQM